MSACPVPFVEQTVLPTPLKGLGALVKTHWPSTHFLVPVFMDQSSPQATLFDDYGFVVRFEIGTCDVSCCILLVQDHFGFSGSLPVANETEHQLFHFWRETKVLAIDKDTLTMCVTLGSIMMLLS